MPGNLRKKPSKPNEDFTERRWWRTSSALLLPLPLPLSTGSLGCIMSCILIHNEWRIGEVPMDFFVYFQHFKFPFFRVTLCICRSRLWAAELYLYGMERKLPFLILMIAPHLGPETLSRVIKSLEDTNTNTETFFWDELKRNRNFSPQKLGKVLKSSKPKPHTLHLMSATFFPLLRFLHS